MKIEGIEYAPESYSSATYKTCATCSWNKFRSSVRCKLHGVQELIEPMFRVCDDWDLNELDYGEMKTKLTILGA